MKFTMTLAALATVAALWSVPASASDNKVFRMVPSDPVNCLPRAYGRVTIAPREGVENMHVELYGLPPNTEFDLFIIQVPKFPFGSSWYQGDITTDSKGFGVGDFVGRFNKETFDVAIGNAPAPKVHHTDATENPKFDPLHMFHLGLWFNSPKDAEDAGCSKLKTVFNGEHNAGVQVLNTSNFSDAWGPLRFVH